MVLDMVVYSLVASRLFLGVLFNITSAVIVPVFGSTLFVLSSDRYIASLTSRILALEWELIVGIWKLECRILDMKLEVSASEKAYRSCWFAAEVIHERTDPLTTLASHSRPVAPSPVTKGGVLDAANPVANSIPEVLRCPNLSEVDGPVHTHLDEAKDQSAIAPHESTGQEASQNSRALCKYQTQQTMKHAGYHNVVADGALKWLPSSSPYPAWRPAPGLGNFGNTMLDPGRSIITYFRKGQLG
jgi:hypothetical protein